jgi:hypothetical protein
MIATIAPRHLGLDTVQYLTPFAKTLYGLGYRTAFRYLNYTRYWRDTPDPDPEHDFKSLSAQELRELLDAGLRVGLVQFGIGSRNQGGEQAGKEVGSAAAYNANGLGIPRHTHIYCDCEWSARHHPIPPLAAQTAYIEAWALAVRQGGYRAGLYVSTSLRHSSAQLYALKGIDSYWSGNSAVPGVDTRGYAIAQGLEQVLDLKTGVVTEWDDSYYQRPAGTWLRFDADMCSATANPNGNRDWPAVVGL